MRRFALKQCAWFVVIAAFLIAGEATAAPADAEAKLPPSGTYQLDPNHASITFKVNHLGFSRYTGRFDKIEGTLNFNNAVPEQSTLDMAVYPNSINSNNIKLEEELRGDKWLNVIKFPRATFHSIQIERLGPVTAKMTGELSLMGVTRRTSFTVTLVGAGESVVSKKSVLGFSATGVIRRSDYGLDNLLPMIGDEVTLQIEAEFDRVD